MEIESHTASKVTNPFSAKLLQAFKKEQKVQHSFDGKDFSAFFRPQNTS